MKRLALAAVVACGAPQHPHVDSFDGVWSGEFVLDTGPAGAIELAAGSDGWHASLGPLAATLEARGDELVGSLGSGELRVERDLSRAHWIQPATPMLGELATPVVLARERDGAYRGRVEPVPSRVPFALVVHGTHAFAREPSRNLGKMLGELAVVADGGHIELRDHRGAVAARGTLERGHLRLEVPAAELAFELEHVEPAWLRARPPGAVTIAAPPMTDDGWRTGTLEDAGIDRSAITALVQRLADEAPDAANSRMLHALVIARHGKLVVDEYFGGDARDVLHDLRSASKTISTTIAGIEVDRGALALDTAVYATLGIEPDDPRKRAIQLQHLLDMSTGLACNDDDDDSPGNEDRMQSQTEQRDWYRYTLALPVASPPGTAFYCSGTMNLVGAMVAAREQRWLVDVVADELFAPLGIARYAIDLQPDREAYFGGGFRMRARDFAKLPQLFLDGGVWNGRRIVSVAWVRAATAAHARLHDPDDYGFGWWRARYGDLDAFFASGNGGQIAMAIPKLDLVIAFQAGNYGAFGVWRHELDELVPAIIAAVRR